MVKETRSSTKSGTVVKHEREGTGEGDCGGQTRGVVHGKWDRGVQGNEIAHKKCDSGQVQSEIVHQEV